MFHLIDRLSVRSAFVLLSPRRVSCEHERKENFLSAWWWSSNKFMCSLWGISMLIYYRRRRLAGAKQFSRGWDRLWGDQKWKSYVPALTSDLERGVFGLTDASHFAHTSSDDACGNTSRTMLAITPPTVASSVWFVYFCRMNAVLFVNKP